MNISSDMAKKDSLPQHVAIIMDGNGRWATGRKLPRFEGHRKGIEAVRRVIESAVQRQIPYLTLYAFSSENWHRPKDEVRFLMDLLQQFMAMDIKKLHQNNIRIKMIGRLEALPAEIQYSINQAIELTAKNSGLVLTIALNYGAWEEMVEAVNKILADKKPDDKKPLTADDIRKYLFTDTLPDPDLLIRTSGEQRLSNFLLMQCAYTELVFQTVLWPDYADTHFAAALEEYRRRDRRYGDVALPDDNEFAEEVVS